MTLHDGHDGHAGHAMHAGGASARRAYGASLDAATESAFRASER